MLLRLLLITVGTLCTTAAQAQPVGPLHVSGEMLVNQVDVHTGIGLSLTAQLRSTGPVSAYVALRPEITSATRGGTGYSWTTDRFQPDGFTPDYSTRECRSNSTGEISSGRCGANTLNGAIAGEVGARVSIRGGALLTGIGLRGGNGAGVYGALTGRLAEPLYLRVEVGTGHASLGLGFGGL